MPPAALLLHELPDGTSHFDWLVARDEAPGSSLLAFRVGLRPDDGAVTAFTATPLPDHRAMYLSFEGPLEPRGPTPRGSVRRLAEGVAEIRTESPAGLEILADWGAGPRRYTGAPTASGRWRFRVTPAG